MQMQGTEAVWKLVLDAHLHCVYPGQKRSTPFRLAQKMVVGLKGEHE